MLRERTLPDPTLPTRDKLVKYLVEAARALGGPSSRREVVAKAMELGPFTQEQRTVPSPARGKHYTTKLEYELNHALSVAKESGDLENLQRDRWSLP